MPDAPSTEDYLAAAAEAAPRFGLEPASIGVLSHSENVVCELTTEAGERFAMRLHRPGYNSMTELDSEVRWVIALGEAGIPVPNAIPTIEGGHYSTVSIADQPVQVGVVSWVDGSPLGGPTEAGEHVVGHYRRIGELCARIRSHSESWTVPDGFTRRRWDLDGFLGEQPLWGRFWEVERLTVDQRTLFATARDRLLRELDALSTDRDAFGLIHADLHLGNLMANDDELTIIDFDDAGFGWYVHELAVALHPVIDEPWFADARASLVAGYRSVRELTDDEASLIDTFIAVRSLMLIGWLAARPEVPIYAEFDELAAQTEAVVRRYLAD